MHAQPQHVHLVGGHEEHAVEDRALPGERRLGQLEGVLVEEVPRSAERRQRRADLAACVLGEGADTQLPERGGAEARQLHGGERQVQLAELLAECPCVVRRGGEQVGSALGPLGGGAAGLAGAGDHGVVVEAERLERHLPGIALVREQLGAHGDGDRVPGGSFQLDRAEHVGDPREPRPGERTADLQLGVLALVHTADQLHHGGVADGDARVGLLPRAHRRGVPLEERLPQPRVGRRDERARPATHATPAGGDAEQRLDPGGVGHRVDDHTTVRSGDDDRAGSGRPLLAPGEGHRIGVTAPGPRPHLHEREDHGVVAGADPEGVDHLRAGDGRGVTGEPAGTLHRLRDGRLEVLAGVRRQRRPATAHLGRLAVLPGLGGGRRVQLEPEEPVWRQGEHVRLVAHRREARVAEDLHRRHPTVALEAQLDRLRVAREVRHHQHAALTLEVAEVREHVVVVGVEELDAPPPERTEPLPQGDQLAGPPQEGRGAPLLDLHVDVLVVVGRVDHRRQVQALWVRVGEAGVAVGRPLHRRPHAVPVAQVDVVAHADLVAVVDDRRPRQGEDDRVEQLDGAAVVVEQWRQATADADVQPHLGVAGVGAVHRVALLVGDHLERQLVVVPQEHRPLAALRRLGGLLHDVDDRGPLLGLQRHVEARHHREVEVHVALVAVAEVGGSVLGPLVRLGEEHPVLVPLVDVAAQRLQVLVGLREVLAVRALTLVEVGHRVEPHPVDAHVEPELGDLLDLPSDRLVVVVQVGLVGEEAVPVVLAGHRIPRPVRRLRVREDDPRLGVLVGVVGPDVVVAPLAAPGSVACPLEPRVLVGRVVDDQLGDHPQPPVVGVTEEPAERTEVAVRGVHRPVVGDVVAVVAARRWIERQQPHGGDPEVHEVVELRAEAVEVADPVAVAVLEGSDVHLVDDAVAVPLGVRLERRRRSLRPRLGRHEGPLWPGARSGCGRSGHAASLPIMPNPKTCARGSEGSRGRGRDGGRRPQGSVLLNAWRRTSSRLRRMSRDRYDWLTPYRSASSTWDSSP